MTEYRAKSGVKNAEKMKMAAGSEQDRKDEIWAIKGMIVGASWVAGLG